MTQKPHGTSYPQKNTIVPRSQFHHGPFGRMFRNLPPFDPPGRDEHEKTDYFERLADKMIERSGGSDNPKIPAGYTYFGQFVDHDITFDPTSSLMRRNDPDQLHNFRTPRFDLDNLYGEGPADEPFMYDKNNDGKLLVGKALSPDEDDLPRNRQDVALIGDPRNDENIFVSQLQLGFIKFHNSVVDYVKASRGLSGNALFLEAQRLVRWHYQWVVIHDFLKRIADPLVVKSVLPTKDCPHRSRLCYYDYKYQPFMPVEFSVAAYRFGHSMVRSKYQLNNIVGRSPKLPVFDSTAPPTALTHFGGFRHLPAKWTIQWDLFLEIEGSNPQKSRHIDTKLADPLSSLPSNINPANRSLAFLNLMRSWRMDLPSGQSVARAMCIKPLPGDCVGYPKGLKSKKYCEDPLWRYILREAEKLNKGHRLGPVGSRIVAEVFIGLLSGDPNSFLNVEPCWKPQFPAKGGTFQLSDILRFAKVPLKASNLPF